MLNELFERSIVCGAGAQFVLGLRASNIWYGHAHALTWVQPQLPEGFDGTSYADSGWCFVEASLSSVIKGAAKRVDLGKFTADELFDPGVFLAIEKCASGTRPPVCLPSRVGSMLQEKSFFARADVDTVAKLYRDFFEAVVPWRRELVLSRLQWGPAEAMELAEALPSFVRLSTLNLNGNQIKDEGFGAICEAVQSNKETKLATLWIGDNGIGPAGAKSLAALVAASPSLSLLYASGNPLGEEGEAALREAVEGRSGFELKV